jgi:hypothetical protein
LRVIIAPFTLAIAQYPPIAIPNYL